MVEKKQFERKHFFIDLKLQGSYILSFFIPMFTMLLFMLATLFFAVHSVVNTASMIVKDDVQNIITIEMQDQWEPSITTYEATLKNISLYLLNFSKNSRYRDAVISNMLWVFGIGIFFVIIQILLLTIFYSHKLAGPVYRFENACRNVIDGNYTEQIILRKGDQLQNLANLINEVVVKSKGRLVALSEAKNDDERKTIRDSLEI